MVNGGQAVFGAKRLRQSLLNFCNHMAQRWCMRAKVQALEEALRLRWGQPVARFHEDMNLLQRDRNAAFFADPDGARVLIASEVGACLL